MPSIQSADKKPTPRVGVLLVRLSFRHFQEEPFRFLLTLLGVGLGMALVVAIRLSNMAALSSFKESIDLLAGKTNLSLSREGSPMPETILKDLIFTRKSGTLLPIVQGKLAPADSPGEFLTVLGVDLLKDTEARQYRLLGGKDRVLTGADLLRLLPRSGIVFLTQRYAGPRGIGAGDRVPFIANDHTVTLTVGGLLADEGAARALDGTLALMDIAAAQEIFNKLGSLDRLEWVVPEEGARVELENKLRTLYPGWRVERPARRGEKVEKMLSAFR